MTDELTPETVRAAVDRYFYWIGRGIRLDGQAIECEGINVFQFDQTGKIINLRGFWNPAQMRVIR